MNYFKKWNRMVGWASFAVAAVVYLMTIEPTVSWWDCPERIASAHGLQIGHPPGTPLFMMVGRIFSLFAPSPAHVGMMVNAMSALCGALTVMLLCWTVAHFGRRIYERNGREMSKPQTWAVLGAGLVGAVAYCFTDTQWFISTEGEVYSMSSMFTALIMWCILQWEERADEPHSARWLVLIAYLLGLTIGVHLLGLLCIPAIVFVWYFKKYPTVTWKGVVKTSVVAGAILVAVFAIIIPYTVSVGAAFDRVFVNGLRLPVNSGLTFFVFLIFGLCAYGIYATHKRGKVVANTIVLCTTFILLGFGSYASVITRAAADPPMNSNDPSNPFSLLSVLNREQYGSRPLLYGPYFTSPITGYETGYSTFLNEETGRYERARVLLVSKPIIPDEFKYVFPRVWAQQKAEEYKAWARIEGRPKFFNGERIMVPTAGENLRFFFNYQLNYMYWRYFLWNFVGRQNDIQGDGGLLYGNWLSGIRFIDERYLGPQDGLPSEMAANKARNTYYFLPFLLGLIGLLYQLKRDKRNFVVVMWLFFMLGIAMVIYFNTTPSEPRERDYIFVGSFYAFSIWVGLGVMALRDWMARLSKRETMAVTAAAVVVASSVPVVLAAQNWESHDRSHRYVARDYGWNYLQSCLPGSIIVNFGDNDTFPLWYNQEVEGVRRDLRIMNATYLGMEDYISQMKRRIWDSDPVPFSLPPEKYVRTNEQLFLIEHFQGERVPLREVMRVIKSDDRRTRIEFPEGSGVWSDFVPARQMYLPVNRENAVESGIVRPEDAHLILDSIPINIRGNSIMKSEMMILDMLDNFDWARPIYFTTVQIVDNLGLQEYMQFDGFAFRLVPIRTPRTAGNPFWGRVDAEYIYPLLMETFRYGNVADPRVYADNFTNYYFAVMQTRNAFSRLANGLMAQGDTVRAVAALDRAIELMPFSQIRHDFVQTVPLINSYYQAGEFEKGNAVLEDYAGVLIEYFEYFLRFRGSKAGRVMRDFENTFFLLDDLLNLAERHGQYAQADVIFRVIGVMYEQYEREE